MPRSHLLLALVASGCLLTAACADDAATPAQPPAPDTSQTQPDDDALPSQAADPAPSTTPQPDDPPPAKEPDPTPAPSETTIATPALVPALGGRNFERPIDLVSLDDGRVLVADQGGVVLAVAGDGSATTFLDISDRVSRAGNEEGLLSIALDAPFADPGNLWLYYSVAAPRRSRLSRFTITGSVADPDSELVIIEIAQPFSNHNGGSVRFGPDGMLYLGLGDGGAGGDPQGNGQNRSTLLGSILRIDVSNASPSTPYVVPADNPFVGQDGVRPEIWAYGVRNPWRMSFDATTRRLWLGDVGQNRFEEIDVVGRGANLGWNAVEGDSCFQDGCELADFVAPIAVYNHNAGCSVTGASSSADRGSPTSTGPTSTATSAPGASGRSTPTCRASRSRSYSRRAQSPPSPKGSTGRSTLSLSAARFYGLRPGSSRFQRARFARLCPIGADDPTATGARPDGDHAMADPLYYSCDSHVVEGPEVFEGLVEQFGERAPHVVIDPPGREGHYLVWPKQNTPLPIGRFGIAGANLELPRRKPASSRVGTASTLV